MVLQRRVSGLYILPGGQTLGVTPLGIFLQRRVSGLYILPGGHTFGTNGRGFARLRLFFIRGAPAGRYRSIYALLKT